MKSICIERKEDQLGKIIVPVKLTRTIVIKIKNILEIFTEGKTIILKRDEPACIFRSKLKDVGDYKGKKIYPEFMKEVKIFVTIEIFLHHWPAVVCSGFGLLSIGVLYYFYYIKQLWIYFYTMILVGFV